MDRKRNTWRIRKTLTPVLRRDADAAAVFDADTVRAVGAATAL